MKKKTKVKCFACGGSDTYTYGHYSSRVANGSRWKDVKLGENGEAVVEIVSPAPEYDFLQRYECLNIQCSIKNFYYCTHKQIKGEGRYYLVGTDLLFTFDGANYLYKQMKAIIEKKEGVEISKEEYPGFYEWVLKGVGKHYDTLKRKHDNKFDSLEKKLTDYENKLNKIKKEMASVKIQSDKIRAEEKLAMT